VWNARGEKKCDINSRVDLHRRKVTTSLENRSVVQGGEENYGGQFGGREDR